VLLKVDVDKMFTLLKVPKEKALGKMIDDVKARVTSVSAILRGDISFEEASEAMRTGFLRALDLDAREEEPSTAELAKAAELSATKFHAREWVYKR
jgi:lipoate-protein ligase A